MFFYFIYNTSNNLISCPRSTWPHNCSDPHITVISTKMTTQSYSFCKFTSNHSLTIIHDTIIKCHKTVLRTIPINYCLNPIIKLNGEETDDNILIVDQRLISEVKKYYNIVPFAYDDAPKDVNSLIVELPSYLNLDAVQSILMMNIQYARTFIKAVFDISCDYPGYSRLRNSHGGTARLTTHGMNENELGKFYTILTHHFWPRSSGFTTVQVRWGEKGSEDATINNNAAKTSSTNATKKPTINVSHKVYDIIKSNQIVSEDERSYITNRNSQSAEVVNSEGNSQSANTTNKPKIVENFNNDEKSYIMALIGKDSTLTLKKDNIREDEEAENPYSIDPLDE